MSIETRLLLQGERLSFYWTEIDGGVRQPIRIAVHVSFSHLTDGSVYIFGVQLRGRPTYIQINSWQRDEIWSNWIADGCPERETA